MEKRAIRKIYNLLSFADESRATVVIFFEIVFGILLSIFSFLIFFNIGKDVLENEYVHWDTAISHFVYSWRSPFLTEIMKFISFLGMDVVIVFSTIIVLILVLDKHKKEAFLFSFASIMGLVINLGLKLLIKRPRPEISPLVKEQTYSFPSSHAMNSFVFYAAIAYFIFHFTKNKKISLAVSSLSILLILLIGLSRIYLGVHYPSDVLAGFVAGFWWFTTVIVLEKTVEFYRLFKKERASA